MAVQPHPYAGDNNNPVDAVNNEILLLSGREVGALLEDQEIEILRVVRLAYEAHARHETALPCSILLRFPADDRNRVIALPAYLGNSFNIAGIKWISSFPNNQYWTAHEPSVGRNHTELTADRSA